MAAPIVRMRMTPPVPIDDADREDHDVLENDRERDGDGAQRGQRVESGERGRGGGRDRERHHEQPSSRSIHPCSNR